MRFHTLSEINKPSVRITSNCICLRSFNLKLSLHHTPSSSKVFTHSMISSSPIWIGRVLERNRWGMSTYLITFCSFYHRQPEDIWICLLDCLWFYLFKDIIYCHLHGAGSALLDKLVFSGSTYSVVPTSKSSGIESSRSFMCISKSAGGSTDPCGTPEGRFRFTIWVLLWRKLLSIVITIYLFSSKFLE